MSKYPMQMVEVNGLLCIERDGEFWFPATEIGRLLGYADPQKAINNLYQRHVQYLQGHTSILNMGMEVGSRDVRVFDEEGAYYLCMKAETPQANEVSLHFARALKELRRQKLQALEAQVKAMEARKTEAVETALALSPLELRRIKQVLGYHRRTLARLLTSARNLGLLRAEDQAGSRCRPLTETERGEIVELRERGMTYAAIARELGRPKDTVRDFCLRAVAATEVDHA